MAAPAELFNLTLLASSGLYVSMLLYFNGFLGAKKTNLPIQWNSEPILWFLTLMFIVSLTFRIAGNDPLAEGPGVWYLTGTGPLLVIYIYLILKIARHAVQQQIFWVMAALSALAILYVLGNIFLAIFAGATTPINYPQRITNLLLWMTSLLCVMLFWCLLVSLWTSFLRGRRLEPGSTERHTAEAKVFQASNAGGISLEPGADIVLDFGMRLVEDHGYKADLRIDRDNTDSPVTVEVSNDRSHWANCEIDEQIPTDYDVPYIGSPWRYVRVSNPGDKATSVDRVYDLD